MFKYLNFTLAYWAWWTIFRSVADRSGEIAIIPFWDWSHDNQVASILLYLLGIALVSKDKSK